MKKQQQKSRVVMGVSLGVLGLFIIGAVAGMGVSVGRVREGVIARTSDVLLASAEVEDGDDVELAVTYWDQRADECMNLYDLESMAAVKSRQFEWSECGYGYDGGVEQGMVEFELGHDGWPVATTGGSLTVNRGVKDFSRWFGSVEDKSQEYNGSLKLKYKAEEGVAEFVYENSEFYPVDFAEFSADDEVSLAGVVRGDKHNHLFTMAFGVPFRVLADGNENFEIRADDDTFVFVGDKLALDMGGVHGAVSGRLRISENGEVYTGVGNEELAYSGIMVNGGSVVRVFHADRDSASSEFMMRFSGVSLNVAKSELADADSSKIEIAYNPGDPTYVAPLGETMVFQPDGTRGFVIMATVMGMVIVVSSVLAVMAAKRLIRK